MTFQKLIILCVSHFSILFVGFAIGIYTLPILSAPPAPSDSEISKVSVHAEYKTNFIRNLQDSDFLHWGEGEVTLSQTHISMLGELAPGPEYKLYLSPKFVQTEAEFKQLKPTMKLVGDVKTFDNFLVKVDPNIVLSEFNTVIVWCEAFNEFITAAKYR